VFALVGIAGLQIAAGSFTGIEYAILGVGMAYTLKDANLAVTKALPNGAAAITSTGIDLGSRTDNDFVADCELLVEAPLLTTADLPDTETMIYDIIGDDNAAMSSPAVVAAAVLTQTGAGAAGDAAAEVRFRVPSDFAHQYIGVQATNSGAGDASDKDVDASLRF